MESETRSQKCTLTPDEKRKLLEEAARMTTEDKSIAMRNVSELQERLKTAKACVEAVQSTIDAKLDTANRGWESRQVECNWIPDRAAQVKRLVRSDTGEVVETRDMPQQQTIDGVTTSAPRRKAPAIDGVEVGQHWQDSAGHIVTVVAVAADSIVVALSDNSTQRIPADKWADWKQVQDITDLCPGGIAPDPDACGIETSPEWTAILRALDREGKTLDEIASDTGVARAGAKGILILMVERGLAVIGTRTTGKAGKPPTIWMLTDKGQEEAAQ